MFVRKIGAAAGVSLVASTLALSAFAPAHADPTFTVDTDDYVAVGSDTTQYVMADLASAWNGSGVADAANHKIASWDACTTTPANTPTAFPCAVTGTFKPNSSAADVARSVVAGSGNGRKALYNAGEEVYTFARSSGAQNGTDTQNGLWSFPFAIDTLVTTTSATTHAPAYLTSGQLLKIYTGQVTDWAQVGGTAGTIKPLLPKTGGTRDTFVAQLALWNGGTAPTLVAQDTWDDDNNDGTPAVAVQEHDPSAIKNDPNAIVPISLGRSAFAGNVIRVVSGWSIDRPMYNVLRSNQISGQPAVPASWLKDSSEMQGIFGPTGFLCNPAQRAAIEAQGFWQLKSTADGGACGVQTQGGAASLAAYDKGVKTTVTATVPAGAPGVTHPITVNVTAPSGTPTGTVAVNIGTWTGTAAYNGTAVTIDAPATIPAGNQPVAVSFKPADIAAFSTSGLDTTLAIAKAVSTPAITVTPAAHAYGVASAVAVKVTGSAGTPTGAVTVRIGSLPARTVALVAGVAKVALPANTAAGSYRVTATYGGNASYNAGTAAARTLTITKAASSVTAKFPKARKGKSKGTVTVRIAGSSVPATGVVKVLKGSKVIATGTVRNGTVTLTLKKGLKKGKNKLTVTYAGNGDVLGSSARITVKA